jgi:DNA-binding transcriptional LysR family regulator
MIDWLSRGIVDIALLEEAANSDQLHVQKIKTLRFALIGPAESPLPQGGAVLFSDVAQLPLILPGHHLGVRAIVNDVATRMKAKPNIRMEVESSRLIGDLLGNGMGYSVFPACYFRQEIADGRLKMWPIDEPSLSISLFIAARKNNEISGRRANAVMDLISGLSLELLGEP